MIQKNSHTPNDTTTNYRRPKSEAARENRNAYMRKYRREHPDKARAWRENYILRAAERLQAAQEEGESE